MTPKIQDNFIKFRIHQVKLLQEAIENFLSWGDDDDNEFEIFFSGTTPDSFQWQAFSNKESYSESGDL